MADTQFLKTPMDVYFYVLGLNDEERWADTDYLGVFTHLRIQYGVWDCNGVKIVNNLIDALETAIINQQPAGFMQAVKNSVYIGNNPAPRAGQTYIEDCICPIIHEWNTCMPPDPWRYD